MKCELLFVLGGGRGFQLNLTLFVSLGFCEFLRWPIAHSTEPSAVAKIKTSSRPAKEATCVSILVFVATNQKRFRVRLLDEVSSLAEVNKANTGFPF